MTRYDYDLIVIGAGSGGVRAARTSAGYGARVAVCEERHLGGTCVNVGCIPKKLLVHAAEYAEHFEDARAYGWQLPGSSFDWPSLVAAKDREIRRLNEMYGRLLEQAGVTLYEQHAALADPHTVEVGGRVITAEHILVATGGKALEAAIPGGEHVIYSDDAFHLDRLPRQIVIAGGGYIGVEFASIFNALGSQVRLVHRHGQLLRDFDEDVRSFLGQELQKKGIELHLGRTIERIDRAAEGLHATLVDGRVLHADCVLYAVGRRPNTAALGLSELGIELGEAGEIPVDDYSQTSVPSVHAIGDVTDRLALTPVAIAEAMALSRTLFAGERATVDYDNVPAAVFSHPSVGTVGLTEERARHRYPEVEIYRTSFRALKHTVTRRPERSMTKLVVDRGSDRVLGCHMVGPEAGEVIQGFAVALSCGATKAQLDATVAIHPTAAEELVTMLKPARAKMDF